MARNRHQQQTQPAQGPPDFPAVSAEDAQREINLTNGTATLPQPEANGAHVKSPELAPLNMSGTVARKPRDPNAPRNKYVVMGLSRTDHQEIVLYRARSMRDAQRWVESVRSMAKVGFEGIMIVRSKIMSSEAF